MLIKSKNNLITYRKIKIYQHSYQLPFFQNARLRKFKNNIKERRRLIQEGIRYYYYFCKIVKRKEKVDQQTIFSETQLLVQDYHLFIKKLELYQDSYYNFLLLLSDNLKQLFTEKYQELKVLDSERIKLEIKNNNNPKIINELRREKNENLRAIVLLGKTSFLMLQKISLLGEGVKKLAEDTQKQKQIIQRFIEDLAVYQELNEYQAKAQKVRQEIAELAQNAITFENSLQDYFAPFQSLIDEVIKVDEQFYATVGEIKLLVENVCQSQYLELNSEDSDNIDEFFLDFMITGYEKGERLKDAFLSFQSTDLTSNSFQFSDQFTSLEQIINKLSIYLSEQFTNQKEFSPTSSVQIVSSDLNLNGIKQGEKEQQILKKSVNVLDYKSDEPDKSQELDYICDGIDYTKLRRLLSCCDWKAADIETTDLLLRVMGKPYWNQVYREDIDNFSCQQLKMIDQLWIQHSHSHFGFSIQKSIWNAIGGHIDYETDKKLGDRLGWREDGRWLSYEQLTFDLSPTTPIGHLPAHWLNYDQQMSDASSVSSGKIQPVSAWRIDSWLLWQMHLFLSKVEACKLLP